MTKRWGILVTACVLAVGTAVAAHPAGAAPAHRLAGSQPAWAQRANKVGTVAPATGITFRGLVTITDEQLNELSKNPVIYAMLGIDDDGVPQGSDLLTVTEVKGKEAAAEVEAAPDDKKPKKSKAAPAPEG